jgi:hypothetical protein
MVSPGGPLAGQAQVLVRQGRAGRAGNPPKGQERGTTRTRRRVTLRPGQPVCLPRHQVDGLSAGRGLAALGASHGRSLRLAGWLRVLA